MKQIILKTQVPATPALGMCTGKLLFLWAFYGWGVAVVWQWAGSDRWAQGAAWALALIAGLALALKILEV